MPRKGASRTRFSGIELSSLPLSPLKTRLQARRKLAERKRNQGNNSDGSENLPPLPTVPAKRQRGILSTPSTAKVAGKRDTKQDKLCKSGHPPVKPIKCATQTVLKRETRKHKKKITKKLVASSNTQTDEDVITTSECQLLLTCIGCQAVGHLPAEVAICCSKIIHCQNCARRATHRKRCPSCRRALKITPLPLVRGLHDVLKIQTGHGMANNGLSLGSAARATRGSYGKDFAISKETQTEGEAVPRSELQELFTCSICQCVVTLPAEVCATCNKLLGCIPCLDRYHSTSQGSSCPYCRRFLHIQKFPCVAGLNDVLKSDADPNVCKFWPEPHSDSDSEEYWESDSESEFGNTSSLIFGSDDSDDYEDMYEDDFEEDESSVYYIGGDVDDNMSTRSSESYESDSSRTTGRCEFQ